MCTCRTPKQHFIAMACNSKSHNIILWHVISKKLSTGKKIIELETMAQGQKQSQNLACFQTYRTDVSGGVTPSKEMRQKAGRKGGSLNL